MSEALHVLNPGAEVIAAFGGLTAVSHSVDAGHDRDPDELLVDNNNGDGNWRDRALCAHTDPEAFFPEKGGSTREAKKICATCPVRDECLDYALKHDEKFGIWGGLSERERRRLKRRRR